MRKWVTHSLRYAYYSFAIAVIVIAMALQSVRLLAPQIDSLRPSIESFLRTEIGANVALGQLDANWYGLRPHVLVNDLSIDDDQGNNLLSIAQADFTLDILTSIVEAQWVWRKVAFNDIYLDVKQHQDGRWKVAGLPAGSSASSTWRYHSPMDLFESIPQVNLDNATIKFTFQNQQTIQVFVPVIKIENLGGFHRMEASASINSKDVFSLILERQTGQVDNNYAKALLEFKEFPIDDVVSGFVKESALSLAPSIPKANPQDLSFIDGSIWLDFVSEQSLDVVGDLSLNRFPAIANISKEFLDHSAKLTVSGSLDRDEGWSVALQNVHIANQPVKAQTVIQSQQEQLSLLVDAIDIGSLSSWVNQHAKQLLPNSVQIALDNMQPRGYLKNVELVVDRSDWKASTLSAMVEGVSVSPSNNIPGFENINGYLETSINGGFINTEGNEFSFFVQNVYEAPFTFDRLDAQIAWSLSPDDNQIVINSNNISATSEFGQANGFFYIDMPWQKGSRKSELILQLGLRDSDAAYTQQLLPKRIPERLKTWLTNSVTGGAVTQAGFVYRGGFSGAANSRSYQLFLDVEDGALDYSEDWPELVDIKASVLLDNQYVTAHVDSASVFDETVENIDVVWPGDGRNTLNVKIESQLSAPVGLRFLNESWLQSKVGDTFENWLATGQLRASVDVDIPLAKEGIGESASQYVDVEFLGNTLELNDQNLSLSSVSGNVIYSTDKGIFSDNLSAVVFDNPLSLSLAQRSTNDFVASEHLQILAQGAVSIDSLSQWTGLSELTVLDGVAPYDLRLHIPFDKQAAPYTAKLQVESDLLGVSSPLPAPFYKAANHRRPFLLESTIANSRLEHNMTIGAQEGESIEPIKAAMLIDSEGPKRSLSGFLMVGDHASTTPPKLVPNNVFSIRASLKEFALDEWIDVFSKQIDSNTKQQSDVQLHYDISAETINIRERQFTDVGIVGTKTQQQWRALLNTPFTKGTLLVDDRLNVPIELSLDYLTLSSSDDESVQVQPQDPLQGVDLSWLRPTQVSIASLVYDDKPLGNWSFTLSPENNGLRVDDLYASFSGLSLHGSGKDSGASLIWQRPTRDELGLTRFIGVLEGGGIQQLFNDWSQEPLFQSEETGFTINVSWSGSPAFFAMSRLQGHMNVAMTNGLFAQSTGQSSSGLLRLFGLFNFDTWARRLRLDFSDLYKKGIVFDSLATRLNFNNGFIYFQEPLVVKSPSSEFTMAGVIDYPNESIDTVLVTTLPVGGNLTFAAALVAGLPAAAGVYIVSKIFKPQVDKVSSLTYAIKGGWAQPEVKFINIFNNELKE